jgi:hypothetical protein
MMKEVPMDIFQQLLGGSRDRQDYEDFINRYQQGPPSEGYSDEEVMSRYQRISSGLPIDSYRQVAEEAFARMSPEEREEFARYVSQQAQRQHLDAPEFSQETDYRRFQDPARLAQATTDLRQQDPGLFDRLFRGEDQGGGSILSNPIAKAGLAGIAAFAAQQIMKRR